jgi:hypothetical protein
LLASVPSREDLRRLPTVDPPSAHGDEEDEARQGVQRAQDSPQRRSALVLGGVNAEDDEKDVKTSGKVHFITVRRFRLAVFFNVWLTRPSFLRRPLLLGACDKRAAFIGHLSRLNIVVTLHSFCIVQNK